MDIFKNIDFSTWLLSFSMFLFFSLGVLKRFIDTKFSITNDNQSKSGRGYKMGDENALFGIELAWHDFYPSFIAVYGIRKVKIHLLPLSYLSFSTVFVLVKSNLMLGFRGKLIMTL